MRSRGMFGISQAAMPSTINRIPSGPKLRHTPSVTMDIQELSISGVYRITHAKFQDDRGSLLKVFAASAFEAHGLQSKFPECFFSTSKRRVVRGMHFQLPPNDHEKVVSVPAGDVVDVVLDIRKNSPTYGCFEAVALGGEEASSIYIPRGIAHGFASLTDGAIVHYLQSSERVSESESGIRFDSFGMKWPVGSPIVSERDKLLSPLNDFDSPFFYEAAE